VARIVAAEMERSKKVSQANGEAVPRPTDPFLYDILTVPDLAAVEASFDRSRLLLQQGTDAAMALDASNSMVSPTGLKGFCNPLDSWALPFKGCIGVA
jgi:hypothetical protein